MLPNTADYSLDTDVEMVAELADWIAAERFGLAHVMHAMRTASALLAVQKAGIPYLVTLTDFFFSCFRVNLSNLSGKLCAGADGGRRCARDCLVPPWTAAGLSGRFQQANALLSGAAARVCPSEFVAEQYRADFPGVAFSVIPHGIDMLALCKGAGAVARDSGTVKLGFIGTLVPQKGVDLLLRAFALVPNRHMQLTICGANGRDETYVGEVRSLAEADSRVKMLRPVPFGEVFGIIESFDAICIPSRVPETYSLVLHEAAAAGVPAIVSALGAPSQFVREYGSGLVVASDDVESWSRTLREVAEKPRMLKDCARRVPLPRRVEEEAFLYQSLYRQFHLS
jgi:glycosyltransferase involved in cell wall biosynthesis